MARIERGISPWRAAVTGVARSAQVARCVRTFRNCREITRVYAGAEMPPGFAAHGRQGFVVPATDPSDVQTVWVVFCAGDYFVPQDCATVLDLGANIGAFTIYAARCRGARTVYAFEPVAATFATLVQNVQANGLTSVQPFQKGIGARSERRRIHLGVTSQHASLIHRGLREYESGDAEDVEIVTLEDLLNGLNLDQVDMAKMDCEGGEVEAILAASDTTLRRIRHISLEYHFPGGISTEAEFFGRLARAGFRCTRRSRAGRVAQFIRE